MTETRLRNDIRRYFDGLVRDGEPVKAVKYPGGPYGESGTPDWHVTYAGLSIWFEAKVGGNKPTDLQLHRLRQWSAAGAITGLVRSVGDVEELVIEARERAAARREFAR